MGGAVHASILKDDIVRAYREEQRGQALQALEGYREICTKAEVIIAFRWHALVSGGR